ncbi:MAG: 2-amino-4-hydroxy-6-hydroxymethyldihydropteridine diphosphokinase [Beijerinckiaceae bacterium]
MPSRTRDTEQPGSARIGLAFGSNIGDRPGNIRMALTRLEAEGICKITALSSLYRTAPWGFAEQESFANVCALARTRLDPAALLAQIKRIETEMGRKDTRRWGPRLIDIDILFYGDAPLATPDLVLPHKELFNRAFVLVPLAEIAPDLRIAGRSIAEAAARLEDQDIEKWPAD